MYYISKKNREGRETFDSLFALFKLLQKHNKKEMNECALITFLENYSETNFDMN